LPKILDRPQRRQIDPEPLRGIDRGERQRQELHGEGPQEVRLAIEQL